jgi:hypothetical protein
LHRTLSSTLIYFKTRLESKSIFQICDALPRSGRNLPRASSSDTDFPICIAVRSEISAKQGSNCFMTTQSRFRKSRLPLQVLALVSLCIFAALASAQTAKVTVDLDKSVNVLTPTTIGLPAVMYDGSAFKPETAPYTRLAGANVIRYPGNDGVANLFHWSTNALTKYKGSDPPYLSPDSNFGNFAKNLDRFGTALVVVNYGSNLDGTGGGDPGEAAAWVAYANGDAADTKPIPKDNGGTDWHTVGFWATIRGQAPLPTDDGFNFLRISHPKPFGIALWQIGDQVYNNGFYGENHTGDADLHAPAPASPKDLGKLGRNPNLSPGFYGARVLDFARAMKAVDPEIRIGASLAEIDGGTTDYNWKEKVWALDWNDKVLKAGCSAMDFVSIEWTTGPTLAPDYKDLDEPGLLSSTRSTIGNILGYLLDDYKVDCPKDHMPRVAFTPAILATWPRVEHPVVATLWVADTYAVLAETGTRNVSWSEMHGPAMLSDDNKKFGPAFMGLEMLHILAHNPGDTFTQASSSNPLVAVHATRRKDGIVALMLINEDPKAAATVAVTLNGGAVGSKGKRIDYGLAQQTAGAPVSQSDMPGLSSKFNVTVPPYTITDILILPGS